MPKSKKTKRQYDDWDEFSYFPSSQPIRRDDGIQSRTKSGKFAKTWWAKRWLQVLETYGLGSRLQRGRSYARSGQVLNLDIQPGLVKSQVQGSRPKPYQVTMKLPLLQEAEWDRVLDAISQQAIFSAQLLNGEMPDDIEQSFTAAGVSLFPLRVQDLNTHCSCPDDANPCKHIAAVYYLLGEQFDLDPFVLFTLRGLTREQVIEGLRRRRASAASGEDAGLPVFEKIAALNEQLDTFWGTAPEDNVFINVAPPKVKHPVLRQLGASPVATDTDLKKIYQAMTEYVLNKVLGETNEEH